MWRFIKTFIASIGYFLTTLLLLLSIFPLQETKSQPLDLGNILDCSPKVIDQNSRLVFEELPDEIKTLQNIKFTIDSITNLQNQLDSFGTYVATNSNTKLSYCVFEQEKRINLDAIEKYFNDKNSEYTFGSANSIIRRVNSLPLIKIENFDIKTPSLLAKTSSCTESVINSRLYIISNIRQDPINTVVMASIELNQIKNAQLYQQAARNLILSGHYLKSYFNCDD